MDGILIAIFIVGSVYCPRVWDGILCWDWIKAGDVATVGCPEYITGFNVSVSIKNFLSNLQ